MSQPQYLSRSVEDMIRVARVVTPPEHMNKWVVTSWGRGWYRDANGDWRSVSTEPGDGGHHYDDEFMREILSEQLNDYGVLEINAIWQMH